MAAEGRVAEALATARATAHRGNIEVARTAAAKQRLAEEDRRGALAAVVEACNRSRSQYPLSSDPSW
jgi:hypothetical protein